MTSQNSQLNVHKANFFSVYNEKTPHAYFAKMQALEYQIPENAKPQINAIIEEIKSYRGGFVSILDLGCSYGVLSALIRFDFHLDTLYRRYRRSTVPSTSQKNEVMWYADRPKRDDVRFYGIDVSPNAINFAMIVGLLDGGVAVDLEDSATSVDALSALPTEVDLIVSTGCVGYITEVTFNKLLRHLSADHPPIIANLVLRAFDYSGIKEVLAQHGFETFKVPSATFVQRRFQDPNEQARILSLLRGAGVQNGRASFPEEDGYYHAELFVSVHRSAKLSTFLDLHEIGKEQ